VRWASCWKTWPQPGKLPRVARSAAHWCESSRSRKTPANRASHRPRRSRGRPAVRVAAGPGQVRCEVFEHLKPADVDPAGEWFTFEKGVTKHGGGKGWADVWKKKGFAWEYKGKNKDLNAAYDQLLKYREALENLPLLTVCDMDRFVLRTNFTSRPTQV
jgi:hypothetical protein